VQYQLNTNMNTNMSTQPAMQAGNKPYFGVGGPGSILPHALQSSPHQIEVGGTNRRASMRSQPGP
jgi:hypothetical protein